MKITEMIAVFQAGKEVTNAQFWKQKTIKANAIMVLISGAVAILNMFDCSLCSLQLTTEQIIGLTTGITTIAGIFNAGSTMATSSKVGFKPKPKKEVANVEESSNEESKSDLSEVDSTLTDDIGKLQ